MNENKNKQLDFDPGISDAELISQLRNVVIPNSLQTKLLSVNTSQEKVQIQSEIHHSHWPRPLIAWIVAASFLIGCLSILWYWNNQSRHDADIAQDSFDNTNGQINPTNKSELQQKTDVKKEAVQVAAQSLKNIEHLEQVVAASWKPSKDYSVTSDHWRASPSSSHFSSLPITSIVRVGDEEDIPAILFHSAQLSEQLGSDEEAVRSEYQLVIDHFPNSTYANKSKKLLEKSQ